MRAGYARWASARGAFPQASEHRVGYVPQRKVAYERASKKRQWLARCERAVIRHAPIVDAIASGDAAQGREVLREHNTSVRDNIVARMEAVVAR